MSRRTLRCGVTGIADLTLECAGILRDAGHEVAWLVSSNAALRTAAARLGLPAWESFDALVASGAGASVDHLFSIINDTILPAPVLALSRGVAVNYHNSPLPRYAGVHATSWAILHGETSHGVAWHEMTDVVDGGDLLKQAEFPLLPGESGLDANLACHEHAVRTFRELVHDLAQGTLHRTPQDPAARSYFAAHRKAPGGGVIRWTDPAVSIERTVRAHALGRSWNTFGSAKMLLGSAFVGLLRLRVLPDVSGLPAGTVVDVGDGGARIATGSSDVLLEAVLGVNGQARTPAEAGIAPGDVLLEPDTALLARVEAFLAGASRAERFWRREVSTARPTLLPLAPSHADEKAAGREVPGPEVRLDAPADAPTVLAAFAAYLHRFAEGERVSVAVSTPSLRAAAAAVAPFATEGVPLSVDLHDTDTVAASVQRVAVRLAELERRGPFCRDLALRYREQPVPLSIAVQIGGGQGAAHGALLTLWVAEDGGAFRFFSREHDGEIYSARALDRASDHLREMLRGCALPDAPIRTLRPVNRETRSWMLGRWSGGDPGTGGGVLWARFEDRCRAAPASVAVVSGGVRMTYAALHAAAERLAGHLAAAGVDRGAAVAVLLPPSPGLAVAVLAVLRAGGVYVPVQADWPAARRSFVLSDTGARVLVTDRADRAPEFRGAVLAIADCAAAGGPAPHDFRRPAPDDVAYVMYTSGSTGTPKGILSTHGGILNRIDWSIGEHGIGPSDVLLQTGSPGFDISYWELLTPLVAGARLVISAHQEQGIHPYLWEMLRREEVTVAHFVPSLLGAFLAELPDAIPELPLREVICGGEALTPDVQQRFFERLPARLHHAYGPTEASISVTQWRCTPAERRSPLPVGRPIAGTRIHVLDRTLEPVPVGVPGEVYIGGVPLARGYLGRPGLTASRFVPSPFAAEAGARLYRTGDVGRRRTDGSLELLGRADGQIKIRGHRVEPGEVEAVLADHPAVERAVVAARPDPAGEPRLVAYVETGAALTRRELRSHAGERLPAAAIPTAWVLMRHLPMLPNGKLDREALPAPAWGARDDGDGYVAPRSTLEVRLCAEWAHVLGVPQVGTQDDFFALGGHSLVATRILSWMQETLGVRLSLGDFFRARTVAALAARIAAAERGSAETVALVPVPRAAPLPLSHAQRRIWIEEQLLDTPGAYNVPVLVRLEGVLREDALAGALDLLVQRHEVLRCAIRLEHGSPVQVFAAPHPFPLVRVDLTDTAREDAAAALAREVEACVRPPFDLSAGPLVRGRLIRTGAESHVLALALHHLVADRWSVEVLFHEVAQAYDALSAGEAPVLAPLPVQYGDYAVWQRGRLAEEPMDASLGYWAHALSDAPETLDLRMGRGRAAAPSYRAGRVDVWLEATDAAELHAVGREHGATPFMVLLAALQALLHRLSGQDDIVVGTPMANRGHPLTGGMAGVFVNPAALRARLQGRPAFADVLRQVRDATFDAHAHQELPFERVVEHVGAHRLPGRHPVFQVMFVLNELWKTPPTIRGLRTTFLAPPSYFSVFDLTLNAREERGGIALEFEYAADRYDPAEIARVADAFVHLLAAAVADPRTPVAALPLASGADTDRWLAAGEGAPGVPRTGPAPVRFAQWAVRTPDAPAIVHGDDVVTYAALDARATAIASALAARGVGRGAVVAVCMGRSPLLVAALLGIHRAGAAFLCLEGSDPDERLRGMVSECSAPLVVTDGRSADRAACLGVPLLLASEVDAPVEAATHVSVCAEDLAYVIYTSGSTGRPKGVMVEHGALENHIDATCAGFGLTSADRVLQFSALNFDAVVEEVFPTLCSGAALVIRTDEMVESAAGFVRGVEAHGITVADLPTGFWHTLADQNAAGEFAAAGSLRLVVIGGERASPARVAAWNRTLAARGRHLRLLNTYGPTEATVVATAADVGDGDDPAREVPIGRPVQGVSARVLDLHLQPLPPEVAGELYLGGACVARGYLGRPGLTAERFPPDPFAKTPGARMYRTGDLVRIGSGGTLEYVGRVDHQVKVRGFRVELGEIEDALSRHPCVAEAAVVLDPAAVEPRIHAYAAPAAGANLDAAVLRAHLAAQLPAYMLPAAFVVLPELPRTTSGKLDRRALRAPEREDAADADYTAPRTELERAVCAVWEEVLGVSRVGVHDDFFALGGHSLAALTLVWQLRARCGLALSLRALFDRPTVAGAVSAAELVSADAPAPDAAVAAGPRRAPLSWAQEAMWVQDRMARATGLYNVPVAFAVRGALDAGALRRALDDLLQRHHALRITLVEDADGLGQQVQAAAAFPLASVDLRHAGAASARAALQAEAMRPFDLFAELPARATLYRLAGDEWWLLLVLHHVAADGWSMMRVCRDLGALYRRATPMADAALPGVAVQYPAVALRERSTPADAAGLAYWSERLTPTPAPLALPFDWTPPALRDHNGAVQLASLAPETVERLRALARETGATLFMAVLAAFQALLHRYTGARDVVVGAPVAGRDDPATRETVGPFVDTVALRTAFDPGVTFRTLLSAVRETTLGALLHASVPLAAVRRALGVERSAGRHPLFQVMFDLDEGAEPVLDLGAAVAASPLPLEMPVAKFDLALSVRVGTHGADLEFRYPTDAFDAGTVARLARHFVRLVDDAVARPDAEVSALELLAADDVRRLLLNGSGEISAADPETDLVARFDAVAERMPDAPAVIEDARKMSYGRLRRLSDALAARLIARGLHPEEPVAVHADRSIEAVVALLAVWKAGGAYVPLDPGQPMARLRHVLRDCGARVVLTAPGQPDSWEDAAVACVPVDVLCAPGDDPSLPVRTGPGPERLAYVMYTSGSTGRPRGVLCTHGGIANRLLWAQEAHPSGPGEGVLWLAAPGFDISLWEMLHPLLSGGRLVVVGRDRQRDVEHLVERIERDGVATAHFVPALLDAFLDHPAAASCRELRQVVCGGDRLSPALRAKHRRVLGVPLHQAYGPTEAAISVTHFDLGGTAHPDRVPLGRPIANVRIHLLDAAGRLTPPGAAGELHIGGAALARGYLGDAALTAARFVPDPWTATPGARMYRTGDLARHLADGSLEYLGRCDAQVKIHGVRVEPGEVEAVLREHPAVAAAAVAVRTESGEPRLVAYAVCAPGHGGAAPAALRHHLAERLPAAMVPSVVVLMDALPLTANGKVDRAALPAPTATPSPSAPADQTGWTDAERAVAGAWSDLLAVEAPALDEDFFHVGGDSVAAIRLVARLRAGGLRVDVRQVFATPTIAGIAAAAVPEIGAGAPPAGEPSGPDTGEVRLTPVQRRFFARRPRVPGHLNQAVLLHPQEPLDPEVLRLALRSLVAAHESLRLRIHLNGGAPRAARCAAPEAAEVLFRTVRVANDDALAQAAAGVHGSLDLGMGPLLGALLAEVDGQGQRLLLTAHHLAVDAASWDALIEDLETAYRQLRGSEPVRLPRATSAFRAWTAAAWQHGARPAVREQTAYWLSALPESAPPLPVDHPGGDNTHASADTVRAVVDASETAGLLATARAYRMRADEVLLTALVQAIGDWTGEPRLLANLEWHGRDESIDAGLDLSRTAGWFSAVYPVHLALESTDGPAGALKGVKTQLRAVPANGIGYGLLRFGDDDRTAALLAARPEPAVGFNYLGQTRTAPAGGLFARTDGGVGPIAAPQNEREHLLEFNSRIVDGRLEVELEYSRAVHRTGTAAALLQRFTERLAALAEHGAAPDAFGYVPADFPLAGLGQAELDALLRGERGVRDVFPLAPMQAGLLFRRLAAPAASDYHTQIVFDVEGAVDEAAFRQAWNSAAAAHACFRTSFRWELLDEPLQVVHAERRLPWRRHDWGAEPAGVVDTRMDALLAADRADGFDLSQAPLARLHWVVLPGGERRVVWSHHHIILDGWSLPLVLRTVGEAYGALTRGEPVRIPEAPSYAAYVGWMRSRAEGAATAFWQAYLSGIREPALLVARRAGASAVRADTPGGTAGSGARRSHAFALNEDCTRALAALAEAHRVTLSTVTLAVWSLLVHQYTGRSDVVTGFVLSVRPPEIPGVEQMVGLCIHTLPLRVHVYDDMDLADLFRAVQNDVLHIHEHVGVSLNRLHALAGVAPTPGLFDSIVVFENYPGDRSGQALGDGARLRVRHAVETTEFPISLIAMPGERLEFELTYASELLDAAMAVRIAEDLNHLFAMVADGMGEEDA
jgi:nocardicin nonribosomal peptide synthetase NocA